MEKVAKFFKVDYDKYEEGCLSNGRKPSKEEYDSIPLPTRATTGSAGYDFFLPFSLTLLPHTTAVIPTGIRTSIKEGWVLMVFPKSGLGFKYRLNLDNTVGIIDSDYYYSDNQGHIMVKITNHSEKTLELARGKSFVQGIFLPFGVTEDDEATKIRNGGFGSTSL